MIRCQRLSHAQALACIAALLGAGASGCDTDAYCFTCDQQALDQDAAAYDSSAGEPDAGGLIEASVGDALLIDSNNCNANLTSDPLNCGVCGNVCAVANAFAKCEQSFCVIDRCAAGYYDQDGELANGCEYECEPVRDPQGEPVAEETVCDGRDDDCDGLIDETYDLQSDTQHCGGCNQVCSPPANAVMTCENGRCVFARCLEGYEDTNGDVTPQSIEQGTTDGCECNQLGIELCNLIDDDCDGSIDEDIDLNTDPNNCGACGAVCGDIFPNANTGCEGAVCVFAGCLPGYYDIDGELKNGCEYACTLSQPPQEVCNGLDDDCNGFVDDGVLPGVGQSCGTDVGQCSTGTQQCVNGALACIGAVMPTFELCDGLNNDCDGAGPDGDIDEGCPVASAAVRLDVGSSPDGDHSTTQLTVSEHGGAVFAAYLDRRSGGANIRLNFLPGVAGAWQNPDLLVAGASEAEVEPWVFASPTNVYVAYGHYNGSSSAVRRIELASCPLPVGAWTKRQAQQSGGAQADSFFVRGVVAGQAAGADQIVLVWQVLNGSSRDIYLQASTDGGQSWLASDRRVNTAAGKAELPSVATDGQGHAFIAWRDARGSQPEVYVDVYDVAADSLAGNQRLSVGNPTRPPSIAADAQGNVHVAWTDLPANERKRIRVASSTNAGASFGASVVVNTPAFADADSPHIVAHGGKAVVAWEDNRSGLSDIYVNTWNGSGWRAAASRADGGPRGTYRSTRPHVALGAGQRVFVAYQEYRGSGTNGQADVHVNFSLDDGQTFQPNDVRVDPGPVGLADSITPFVIVPAMGTDAVVVWLDNIDGNTVSPNADVYAAKLLFP